MEKTITIERLKQIIYEEIVAELAPCKDDKGRIAKCEKGRIYSLTNTNKGKVKDCYVKRGIYQGRSADGCPKVSARYGANTSPTKSAGRKSMSGKDIKPKLRLKGYPKPYYEPKKDLAEKSKRELEKVFFGTEELSSLANGIMETDKGTIEIDIEKYLMLLDAYKILHSAKPRVIESIQKNVNCKDTECYKIGYAEGQRQYVRAINAQALASKGELNDKPE
jgi:hypothetical protein